MQSGRDAATPFDLKTVIRLTYHNNHRQYSFCLNSRGHFKDNKLTVRGKQPMKSQEDGKLPTGSPCYDLRGAASWRRRGQSEERLFVSLPQLRRRCRRSW